MSSFVNETLDVEVCLPDDDTGNILDLDDPRFVPTLATLEPTSAALYSHSPPRSGRSDRCSATPPGRWS